MKIDNRIFLPFAGPFVLLVLARAVWWLAGAEWSEPTEYASLSIFFGLFFGAAAMTACFVNHISLGHTTIGRAK